MEFSYQVGQEIKTVAVERDGDRFRVVVGDRVYVVTVRQREQGELDLEVDGRQWCAHVAREGAHHYVALGGDTWVLERPRPRQRRAAAGTGSDPTGLVATMPSLILNVLVAEGDRVERGETLVLLEAMKMELRLSAPSTGRVSKVHCAAGQFVERGQVLVEIEEEET